MWKFLWEWTKTVFNLARDMTDLKDEVTSLREDLTRQERINRRSHYTA